MNTCKKNHQFRIQNIVRVPFSYKENIFNKIKRSEHRYKGVFKKSLILYFESIQIYPVQKYSLKGPIHKYRNL